MRQHVHVSGPAGRACRSRAPRRRAREARSRDDKAAERHRRAKRSFLARRSARSDAFPGARDSEKRAVARRVSAKSREFLLKRLRGTARLREDAKLETRHERTEHRSTTQRCCAQRSRARGAGSRVSTRRARALVREKSMPDSLTHRSPRGRAKSVGSRWTSVREGRRPVVTVPPRLTRVRSLLCGASRECLARAVKCPRGAGATRSGDTERTKKPSHVACEPQTAESPANFNQNRRQRAVFRPLFRGQLE